MLSASDHEAGEAAFVLLQLRLEDSNRMEAAEGLRRLQQALVLGPIQNQARQIMHGTVPDEIFYSDSDAATVLSFMLTQNPDSQLRDALWYLEHHAYNVDIAMQGFELDTIDRSGAPVKIGSIHEVDYQQENPKVDRSLALPGASFDQEKLSLRVTQNGKSKVHIFPGAGKFDKTNIEHVKDLNRWRHKEIRAKIGRAVRNAAGERYHPLEITSLEESCMNAALRLLSTRAIDYKKSIDYKVITRQHKDYFVGQMLPGRYEPAPERSQSSISNFWIRRYADADKKKKQGPDHLKAGIALRDSGKFKARRINMLKAMGRYDEANEMEAIVGEEVSGEQAGAQALSGYQQ